MLHRPELHGTRGAVSSTHWLASATGMAMLDRGGNAFDAATAAALVIQVVEPHLNGPAGDVPILAYDAAAERALVICGQGPMPAAATPAAIHALGLAEVPGSGLLAACVPGAFGAWMRLLRDHGRLRVEDVLEPAIAYAEHGYPLLPKAAEMIEVLAPLFRDEWTESGRTYLHHGAAPAPGARMRNPDLARTYRRILAEARAATTDRAGQAEAACAAFYDGFVAEAIDRHLATAEAVDATGRRNRALLTGADLAGWRPTVEEPVAVDYRGYRVHKAGPWSQGPVFLQQLALLEGFDLGAMAFGGADHLHTVVEAAKLAFADREAWYGDPRHADVPLRTLLSPEYAAERRALIGDRASDVLRPGSPDGRAPRIPPVLDRPAPPPDAPDWLGQLDSGIPTVVLRTAARGDTTCVSVTDRDGNMVVATPSGGWLKSSPVIPGLGFPLGTRGQMTNLVEGHPNVLAPGKRPRTTLSPSLVLRDGRPHLAFGTPGGDQQDQWTLQFFLGHVDFGMNLQEAVEARTFHTDHPPTSFTPRLSNPRALVVERGFDARALAELERRGHEIREVPPHTLGKVCATGPTADGGVRAAASHRGEQAYAVVR
ncbi:gamma-glutamyltransferase family protein [Allostreptomyces psammosilenae]|uniref:Gamma-glutamyltranspeptidase/glutathione hydrolase n=1 Tax=Allostreptomyces psammosilenae TaxID=1892865 RepID=A0A852ZQM0_9ACTN|nr:gamma-glutamyltransferase family protein [Allostreptomyces psammosilenae]NYI04679.1 gamma-glutamyltranspeptidase/glutathione hydrolase [Allostreptomyces psammosilenae]